MIALNAHYDGKVIVPDEPLALAANQRVRIQIEPIESSPNSAPKPKRQLGMQPDLVVYMAPDWDDPLPEDIWLHNTEDNDQGKP